jgi:hypothetical protein
MKTVKLLLGLILFCLLLSGCKPAVQCNGDTCLTLEVTVDGIPASDALPSGTGVGIKSITDAAVANVYVKAFQKSTRVHLPQGGTPNAVASLIKAGGVWKGTLSLPNPSGDVVFLAYAVSTDARHLYSGTYEIANIQDDPGLPFMITVVGNSNGTTAAYSMGGWGPGGGWIFYDAGDYTKGWRYMEAAPNTWNNLNGTEPILTWSNIVSTGVWKTPPPPKPIAIGTGKTNTTAIINQPGHTASAAKSCDTLVFNAYGDWFLPSKNELNAMFINLHDKSEESRLGGFDTDSYYWSSSEVLDTTAWAQAFVTDFGGEQVSPSKNATHVYETYGLHVRPAREF